jgi:hypothetical protein
MMVKKVIAGAAIVAAGLGVASTASAEPTKNVEAFVCDGVPTEIVTAGRNGWIDGVRWQAMEFTVTGVATPTGGAPETINDHKEWAGGATGAADEVTCVQAINDSGDEGTFIGQVEVIIRPG